MRRTTVTTRHAFLIGTSALLVMTPALAQVPQTLSYQGVLTDNDGTPVADDDYDLTFRIYDTASGGAALWTEAKVVAVVDGTFSTILGTTAELDLPFNQAYWLGIQVADDPELTPRIQLTASPYTLNVADGKVVKSMNGLTDDVTLAAGANVVITPSDGTLTISATGTGADADWVVDGSDMYAAVPGDVGIGTVSPAADLHVGSSGNTELRIDSDDYMGTISFYGSLNGSDRDGYIVKDNDDGTLRLSADGSTDAVTILETGRLGIGTRTPNAVLDVGSVGGDGGTVSVRNASSQETVQIMGDAERPGGTNGGARISLSNGGNESAENIVLDAYQQSLTATIMVSSPEGGLALISGGFDDRPASFTVWTEPTLGHRYAEIEGPVLTLYTGWGSETIRFDGVTGDKSAVVTTQDYGQRQLYCMESPEIWFEDFGRGQLVGGVARIDLDPIFLQTVTIDDDNPMNVFVTLTDDCNGVYVRNGTDHFTVHELAGGRGNATFNWRLVAKKRGREDVRLAQSATPEQMYVHADGR